MIRFLSGLFLPLLLLAAASCSRPGSIEQYVFDDGDGKYEFLLDMTDSTLVYDLSFYTKIFGTDSPRSFPVRVYFTSPSGRDYVESVFYDASEDKVVPYRSGLNPKEHGVWTLTLMARSQGLDGLGVILGNRRLNDKK